MARGDDARFDEVQRELAYLELYQHSLRLIGRKLAARSNEASAEMRGALYERSLQLAEECATALRGLVGKLRSEDLGHLDVALRAVTLAVRRASQASGHMLFAINVWRVVEAVERFLTEVAANYGYATLAETVALDRATAAPGAAAPAAPEVAAYQQAWARPAESVEPLPVASWRSIPRWRLRRLRRPGLLLGVAIVLGFVAVSLAAPVLAPPGSDDPYTMPRESYKVNPEPPRAGHPLGTTERSFDVFYGLVWGTHIAFRLGLSVTAGRMLGGVVIGLISGYYGGWLDAVVMRITDAFLAFPIVAATLVMLAFFGPLGLAEVARGSGVDFVIIVSLILFGWMQYARLVRGNVLAERAKQYVEAAVAVGAGNRHIVWRHILPNIPQGLFVLAASDVGAMVVLGAVFAFLGFSGPAGHADWGWLLWIGRNWIVGTPANAFQYWYAYVPPIAAIFLFSTGWNLVGDGLRDVLDPRAQ
jgi:peptide/nickel transport system permease protein